MRAHNRAITAAFWSANWTGGSKARLGDVLIREPGAAEAAVAQTPDQHIAAMDAWVICTGGSTEPKRRRRKKKA